MEEYYKAGQILIELVEIVSCFLGKGEHIQISRNLEQPQILGTRSTFNFHFPYFL